MRPIAFDGCLGWLHDGTGTRGVVMCSALGLDEQCARQSWRILADEIAAAGMPTLRFDYHGTGDSAGLLADPERLSTWLANIETAAAWLQGQAGITELVFVGLRFGATLATVAAAAHGKVARLVLLAPLASGRAYGRELQLASHVMVATGGDKATPDARNSGITDYGVDVAGFVIPRHVLDDLRQIDLMRPMRLPAKDVLTISAPGRPADSKLADHLATLGATVTRRESTDYQRMMIDPTGSRPCLATIRSVAAWLQQPPTAAVRLAHAGGVVAPLPAVVIADAAWRESPQQFGPGRHLVGILCEPATPAPGRPCVIMLNGGRDSHIGWARSSVELARSLAADGIASLRFDLTRIADSQPDRRGRRGSLYTLSSIRDVTAAVDLIETRNYPNITLFGICSGAHLALHTALADQRVKTLILRNVQRFVWRFDDRIMFSRLGKVLTPGARAALTGSAQLLSRLRGDGPRLQRALAGFSASGGRMLLSYDASDAGRTYLDEMFGADGSRLKGLAGIDVGFITGADHKSSSSRLRALLCDLVCGFILETPAAAGARGPSRTAAGTGQQP